MQKAQETFKSKVPELAVCEQVCNGAKHFQLDNPNLKPFNVATDVRATDDLAGITRDFVPVEDEHMDVILTPVVSITDKEGLAWTGINLFHRVLRFWQTELGLSGRAG